MLDLEHLPLTPGPAGVAVGAQGQQRSVRGGRPDVRVPFLTYLEGACVKELPEPGVRQHRSDERGQLLYQVSLAAGRLPGVADEDDQRRLRAADELGEALHEVP